MPSSPPTRRGRPAEADPAEAAQPRGLAARLRVRPRMAAGPDRLGRRLARREVWRLADLRRGTGGLCVEVWMTRRMARTRGWLGAVPSDGLRRVLAADHLPDSGPSSEDGPRRTLRRPPARRAIVAIDRSGDPAPSGAPPEPSPPPDVKPRSHPPDRGPCPWRASPRVTEQPPRPSAWRSFAPDPGGGAGLGRRGLRHPEDMRIVWEALPLRGYHDLLGTGPRDPRR